MDNRRCQSLRAATARGWPARGRGGHAAITACMFEIGGLFEQFGGVLGVNMPTMDHAHELRDAISALRETSSVIQKDLLQLQDGFLTLYCERSVVQSGADVTSMEHIQDLRDEISALCKTPSVSRPQSPGAVRRRYSSAGSAPGQPEGDVLQLRDDFLVLRNEQSAVQCGVDVSSMEYLRHFREGSVRMVVLALRSKRSAVQPGVDVLSMDHVQDDLFALRSEFEAQNDFVLVDTVGHSTIMEATRPLEVLEIDRSFPTDVAAIPRQMDKLRQVTTVEGAFLLPAFRHWTPAGVSWTTCWAS